MRRQWSRGLLALGVVVFLSLGVAARAWGVGGGRRESVVLRELNVRVANHSYDRQRSIKVSHCLR